MERNFVISILIINGPNLNILGKRETHHYGILDLNAIEQKCNELAKELGTELEFIQSNHEGSLVDSIQLAQDKHQGIIINAGAYTHTSVAIVDAVLGVKLPVIEVHLSNIYKREGFRHHSYLSPVAIGGVFGFGATSYLLALRAMVDYLGR
ncbi:MAG: type II 3-dehydroquinate dehydratase [Rhodobacteraceae bacterium]|nr:type II 3-dehydroquinate dehydratase [Paracoccaceae bacterium]